MESHIRSNAELVRSVARDTLGVSVDYDEAGVRWLDQYIDGQRQAASQELKERLPSTLGSYLGECVRLTYGGEWVQDPEQGWSVKINEKLSVYPFNKVRKQLANAEGESVLGFFTAIAALRDGRPAPVAPRRPWWRFW
jgi:hypothetical protein